MLDIEKLKNVPYSYEEVIFKHQHDIEECQREIDAKKELLYDLIHNLELKIEKYDEEYDALDIEWKEASDLRYAIDSLLDSEYINDNSYYIPYGVPEQFVSIFESLGCTVYENGVIEKNDNFILKKIKKKD